MDVISRSSVVGVSKFIFQWFSVLFQWVHIQKICFWQFLISVFPQRRTMAKTRFLLQKEGNNGIYARIAHLLVRAKLYFVAMLRFFHASDCTYACVLCVRVRCARVCILCVWVVFESWMYVIYMVCMCAFRVVCAYVCRACVVCIVCLMFTDVMCVCIVCLICTCVVCVCIWIAGTTPAWWRGPFPLWNVRRFVTTSFPLCYLSEHVVLWHKYTLAQTVRWFVFFTVQSTYTAAS